MKIILMLQAVLLAVFINHAVAASPVELPHLTITPPNGVTLPETISNLNGNFNSNGTAYESGLLPLLSQTLNELGLSNYSAFHQVDGIMEVTGTDNAKKFYFMPPTNDQFEAVDSGGKPGLELKKDGSYTVTTSGGLRVNLHAAPKNPALLMEALGGATAGANVKISKEGRVVMEIPNPNGENTLLNGVFDPMVTMAASGVQPGITFDGMAGIEEIATIVYSDGTQQLFHQTVLDRQGLNIAAGIPLTYQADGTIRFELDGNPWYAVPGLI